MSFPTQFLEIKEEEDEIRSTFYEKKLYEDPFYKLHKFDPVIFLKEDVTCIFNNILKIAGKGAVIAGGSIVSNLEKHSDVDIFLYGLTEKEAEEVILNFSLQRYDTCRINHHCASFKIWGTEIQIIRRIYKSPAEILYGFDIDCCGILYDGKDIWCTRRAQYAIENKINHFDPERVSPSYPYRLAKYAARGFKIFLPNFDEKQFDKETFKKYYIKAVEGEFDEDEYDLTSDEDFKKMMIYHRSKFDKKYFKPILCLFLGYFFGLYFKSIVGKKGIDYDQEEKEEEIENRALSFTGNIDIYYGENFIYSTGAHIELVSMLLGKGDQDLVEHYKTFKWMTENPMQQVTSSFNPQKIEDLDAWYRQCFLYKKKIIKRKTFVGIPKEFVLAFQTGNTILARMVGCNNLSVLKTAKDVEEAWLIMKPYKTEEEERKIGLYHGKNVRSLKK